MNFRSVSIPVTMVVTFSLTLGISLWEQRRENGQPMTQATTAQTATAARTVMQTIPESARAVPPANLAPSPPAPQSSQTDPGQPDFSQEEVPVRFAMRQVPGQAGPKVTLQNQSPQPITVTVTAVNATSGSTSTVRATIEPYHNGNLTDAGLIVSPTDRITIQSPPYRDQEFEAR